MRRTPRTWRRGSRSRAWCAGWRGRGSPGRGPGQGEDRARGRREGAAAGCGGRGGRRELGGLRGLNGNGMEQCWSGGLVLPTTGLRKGDSWTRSSATKGPDRSIAKVEMKYPYEGGEPMARFALKPRVSLEAEKDK